MQRVRSNNKGFTLVEILIVVIILGILAAIVIPQFSNASTDAKKNSLTSQLQTLRSQFELYKLQHNDQLPPAFKNGSGVVSDWSEMTGQTDVAGTVVAAPTTGATVYGPYLQQKPANPLNGKDGVAVQTTDAAFGGSTPGGGSTSNVGFVMNTATGKIWGTSATSSYIYDESNPNATTNDQ
jgi:general secretion pathway protein G